MSCMFPLKKLSSNPGLFLIIFPWGRITIKSLNLQGRDICDNLNNSLSHCTTISNDSFWGTCRSLLSNFDDTVFWNTSPYEDFRPNTFSFLLRFCVFFWGGWGPFTHTFTLENLSKPLAYFLSTWLGRRCCKELTLGHVTKWYNGDLCTIMNFCNHSTK